MPSPSLLLQPRILIDSTNLAYQNLTPSLIPPTILPPLHRLASKHPHSVPQPTPASLQNEATHHVTQTDTSIKGVHGDARVSAPPLGRHYTRLINMDAANYI
jgi:hypothetical protein